jgi:hypothetical protein
VYVANQTVQDNGYCDTELCHQKYRFQWHGRNPCHSNYVCTELEGNICGDFGVSLSYRLPGDSFGQKGEERVTDVCYEQYVYEGTVTDEHSLEIKLWFHPDAVFHAECFIWCTTEGNLPDKVKEPEVDAEEIINIVS